MLGGPRTVSPPPPPGRGFLTGPIHPAAPAPLPSLARDASTARQGGREGPCGGADRPLPPPWRRRTPTAPALRYPLWRRFRRLAPRRTGSDATRARAETGARAGRIIKEGAGGAGLTITLAARWGSRVRAPRALAGSVVRRGRRPRGALTGVSRPVPPPASKHRPPRREGCSDGKRPEERNIPLSEGQLVVSSAGPRVLRERVGDISSVVPPR